MADITYAYSRKWKELERPPDFHAYEADPLCSIAPHLPLRERYDFADPREMEFQNVPQVSEAQTNTERISARHRGMCHQEGGWPLNVDPSEFEERTKYCKKVERDEAYYNTCVSFVRGSLETCVNQNNAINIYESYFDNEEEVTAVNAALGDPDAIPGMNVVAVTKDPEAKTGAAAASLCWSPDGRRLAVAYSALRYNAAVSHKSYIWDLSDPNVPSDTLATASPLVSVEYYGKDHHLIAGGAADGSVSYWDMRHGERAVAHSVVEEGHKNPAWAVKWLQSKSGELLSVSSDARALIWDLRLTDRPVEIHVLPDECLQLEPKSNEGGTSGSLGGLCIDYDPAVGGPAKYLVGTEQGTILSCSRKGKTAHEKIGNNTFNGHHGPVYAVQRNPQHPKYFLSVGDWTARIWFDDFKSTSIYQTYYHTSLLTSGAWHPIRPAVFFTTHTDGCVCAWDLLHRHRRPVATISVSSSALRSFRAATEGRHTAVGAVDGTVSILQLLPTLYTPVVNEKVNVGLILENEAAMDKNLEKQAKERRALHGKRRLSRPSVVKPSVGLQGTENIELKLKRYSETVAKLKAEESKLIEAYVKRRQQLTEDIKDGLEVEN